MYSHSKAALRQLGRRLKLYDDDREVMEKNKEAENIIDRFVEIREMMGNRKNERNQEKMSGIITIKIQ
jgi:proteasome assembly chaperone (PAC2) family protein